MRLPARIRVRRILPVVVTRPGDPKCRAVAIITGKRCPLPAGPDGYCGVLHRGGPAGPRPA
jgi:hypothetical protein